eukprot:CAMPEP_0114460832 /NCGR_PEP_ID=MMETSP0104-20121206/5956_1 /TAXON_ID=37642 ORGANISM="Paraphysomonas imperforata, Strain PA2" /NCGR_SAMPLE_ID=MMETSP0104 /ASSEMBLY_ACC=CAM_ASM_000202 /LENGTH=184 /DNA_ID=CAMNT_0001633571 /DNA_START=762 /DNA_END=1316 /DNA_ORIENTATION=-
MLHVDPRPPPRHVCVQVLLHVLIALPAASALLSSQRPLPVLQPHRVLELLLAVRAPRAVHQLPWNDISSLAIPRHDSLRPLHGRDVLVAHLCPPANQVRVQEGLQLRRAAVPPLASATLRGALQRLLPLAQFLRIFVFLRSLGVALMIAPLLRQSASARDVPLHYTLRLDEAVIQSLEHLALAY